MDKYIREVSEKINDIQEEIEIGEKTIELLNESYKLGHDLHHADAYSAISVCPVNVKSGIFGCAFTLSIWFSCLSISHI